MNGFEDLLGRLTHRLRVDPELQMEVAHELRAHLEDAVAECRAAGMTEEQALSTAVKAMGNEAEIAEQLWQANRQRVRVRKVVQWAAGATLMPAAIAVSVTVAWGAIVSVALLLPMVAGLWGDYGRGSVANRIADRFRQDALATLSPESRFIVETPREDVEASLTKAQALTERYPDDPVYCAHYAAQLLGRAGLGASAQQTVAVLERGKQIEPDNAFYPLAMAGLLLRGSSNRTEDDDHPPAAVPYVDSDGRPRHLTWSTRVEVFDPAAFARGLAELREAAGKPYLSSHAADLAERRMRLLPAPTRVSDALLQGEVEQSALSSTEHTSVLASAIQIAGCYAVQEAAQGQKQEALQLLRDERKVSQLAAQGARLPNELYNADAMYHSTLRQEAGIQQLLGGPQEAQEAVVRFREYYGVFVTLFQDRDREAIAQRYLRQASVADLNGTYFADPAKVNLTPGRRADYAVLDRLGLSALLIVLTIAGMLPAIGAVGRKLRTGRWPAIAFMGWGRLARVVLVGVLGPLAVYAGYAYLTPLGGRSYGTFASVERIGVEYAAVACAVIVLLRVLSEAALRRRGVELGTDELVRERPGKVAIVVGILLGAAIATYLAAWHVAAARFEWSHGSPTGGWGMLLAIAVASYGLTWMGSAAGGEGRGGWWRYMPAWVGWAATAAALGTAGWRLWGKPLEHNQAMLLNMVSHAIVLAAGAATLALVGIMVILGRRLRDGSGSRPGVFSYRLSVAPAILLASLGLALVAAAPLRLAEKRAVAAMNAPGGSYKASQGIDLSYQRAVQERLERLTR